jgi:hypothetical protein
MIIDLILDAKDGYPWMEDYVEYIRHEEELCGMDYRIWEALANKDREEFVKRCKKYIDEQDYGEYRVKSCLGKVFDALVYVMENAPMEKWSVHCPNARKNDIICFE